MVSQISQILADSHQNDDYIIEQINALALSDGDDVYQEALAQLVGKKFPVEQAARYWHEALDLQHRSCQTKCSHQNLRSSLLSYLFQVVGEMRDPRIVEADDLANYIHASVTDGLTGLYHQSYLKAHLEQLVSRLGADSTQEFAVVMFDLDHFKQYNDRCGHLAGDQALLQVAQILQQSARQADLAVRYGGEEFALVLHRLNRPQAAMVAERVRKSVENYPFIDQEKLDLGSLTISGGIAFFPEDGTTGLDLLQVADERLYKAKQRRNALYPINQDQRTSQRVPLNSLIEFSLGDSDAFSSALSRDLSPVGITLLLDVEPTIDSLIEIRFKKPFWPVDCALIGRVRNTSELHDGRLYRVGLQFDSNEVNILTLMQNSNR